jgi:hypothetical protein
VDNTLLSQRIDNRTLAQSVEIEESETKRRKRKRQAMMTTIDRKVCTISEVDSDGNVFVWANKADFWRSGDDNMVDAIKMADPFFCPFDGTND